MHSQPFIHAHVKVCTLPLFLSL